MQLDLEHFRPAADRCRDLLQESVKVDWENAPTDCVLDLVELARLGLSTFESMATSLAEHEAGLSRPAGEILNELRESQDAFVVRRFIELWNAGRVQQEYREGVWHDCKSQWSSAFRLKPADLTCDQPEG